MRLQVPVHVGFLPPCKNIPVGGLATLNDLSVRMSVYGAVWWNSVSSRVYSHHVPSVPRKSSGSTATMTKLKMNESLTNVLRMFSKYSTGLEKVRLQHSSNVLNTCAALKNVLTSY